MARAYYNEIDPFAAAWLRELIRTGHIANGDVDERSIVDIRPSELDGYTQCHFFAGIGVWSHALRRAGWPDDRPVWTGSCPCQPFSAAGKGGGFDDERHLWPHFHHLIRERRPDVVFGEQVASKDGLDWFDLVQADLEGTGYAAGAVDLCAAGVGAPHIRQRLWWFGERVADAELPSQSRQRPVGGAALCEQDADRFARSGVVVGLDGDASHAGLLQGQAATVGGRLEHYEGDGRQQWRPEPSGRGSAGGRGDGGRAVSDNTERRSDLSGRDQRDGPDAGRAQGASHVGTGGASGRVADAGRIGLRSGQPGSVAGAPATNTGTLGQRERFRADVEHGSARGRDAAGMRPGPTNGLWRDADWLFCRDGKWRPVEPGTFPLAHGAPARVERLRGYGNAIVAEAAVAFIDAYLETKTLDLRAAA